MTSFFDRLRIRVTDAYDLWKSHKTSVADIDSVCLLLGPYRNLTTLTAATLFLHPNCQVLNHAGARVYGTSKIDFLDGFSTRKLDRFIQFALAISEKGTRGDLGGSITFSHGFDPERAMHDAIDGYLSPAKEHVTSLIWKESLLTSIMLRKRHVDLASIFRDEKRLRFLLPIRNPLDCAVSNMKTGHALRLPGIVKESSMLEVLRAILDEIFWFAGLEHRFPARFFHFTEFDAGPDLLGSLATFLELEPYPSWLSEATSAFKIESGYSHGASTLAFFREYVAVRRRSFPQLVDELLRFAKA